RRAGRPVPEAAVGDRPAHPRPPRGRRRRRAGDPARRVPAGRRLPGRRVGADVAAPDPGQRLHRPDPKGEPPPHRPAPRGRAAGAGSGRGVGRRHPAVGRRRARRAARPPAGGGGARGRARLAGRGGRPGPGGAGRHGEEPVRPRPAPAGRAAGPRAGGGAVTDRTERPALPAELLADLDAGLLDPERAAEVREAAARAADATAVLAGLAATRAELAGLADPPLPARYAARWDAALAAEAAARPSRRSRRRRVRPALVAAAVLAATLVVGLLWGPRGGEPISLDGVDPVAAGLTVRGDFDVGDLADPGRRAACLLAVAPPGVDPQAPLLGGR